VTTIPRYRAYEGTAILSAGFRPFFLGSSIWAAIGAPLWLYAYTGGLIVPTALPPPIWHAHEMIFGFSAATVAGFLLTAIPNWTGRTPLRGGPLATLVFLWAIGRVAVLLSAVIGSPAAAVADLSFPAVFLAVVAREIVAGRNWRNMPMLAALSLLLIGNLLVHLDALGIADTAQLGNRLGLVTLFLLISLVGGRIIPSFTCNWLTKARPKVPPPVAESRLDITALVATAVALISWAFAPNTPATSWAAVIAGVAAALRLSRWRGLQTGAEPLLLILHIGYGWLVFGLLLLGINGLSGVLPATAALHALTVGAIGTMTLSVMTRATLGHTGRPLVAGPVTQAIFGLVTMAAVLRVLSPFAGAQMQLALWAAAAAWSGAFGLFALSYGGALVQPRIGPAAGRPI
jgi:uncharacterized protein involved in response to NO